MSERRMNSRAVLMSLALAVTLTACDGGSRVTGGETPTTTITLDLSRAGVASLRASGVRYRAVLNNDRSITVSGDGHTVLFKGNRALVDGRFSIRLTDRAAVMIERGISEMENRQSAPYRRMLDAAARRMSWSGKSIQSRPASALLAMPAISTSFAMGAPDCESLSLALDLQGLVLDSSRNDVKD